MAKLRAIQTDIKKQEDGVWIPYDLGIELLIARTGNKNFQECHRKLMEPLKPAVRAQTVKIEDVTAVTKEAVAKHILLGWKNIEDENDQAIEYSPEKALEFFNDPELADFYNYIVACSKNAEFYRKDMQEASVKN